MNRFTKQTASYWKQLGSVVRNEFRHRLFFELRDRLGQTIVIVTHDEHLAAMADRRITMSDGRIL